MMKITPPNINIKNIKTPQNVPAEAFAFPLLCGYHAYQDYKQEKHNKEQTFLMNIFVLAGTSLGALAGYKTFSKILSKTKHLSQIKKDTIESIGAPFGGLLGGFGFSTIGASYLEYQNMQKAKTPPTTQETKAKPKPQTLTTSTAPIQKPVKPHERELKILKQIGTISLAIAGAVVGNRTSIYFLQSQKFKKAKLTQFSQNAINITSIAIGATVGLFGADRLMNKEKPTIDKKTAQNIDTFLSELTPNVTTFDAMKEKNLQTRVQKSFYEIISSIVVPSAMVLPTLYFLRNRLKDDKLFEKQLKFVNKITKNRETQRVLCEKAVTIPLAIGSYFAGDKVGQIFDQKVTKKILDQEFWDDLEEKKQEAFMATREGLQNNDNEKVEKALEEIERYEEIQKKLRKAKEKSKEKSKTKEAKSL
ncbi:MAG: hypothetical protein PHE78_05535 [Candidatus Gastranaerophilales bacterium]|nr:hypothetical protein [Candidatus Gastranaerophilales bacterium]